MQDHGVNDAERLGGGGAVHAATTRKFAAAVPVAGTASARADALQGVAVWAFHGKNDVVVPSHVSEHLVAGLRRAGVAEASAKLEHFADIGAEMIERLDRDGDGGVDFDELQRDAARNPTLYAILLGCEAAPGAALNGAKKAS